MYTQTKFTSLEAFGRQVRAAAVIVALALLTAGQLRSQDRPVSRIAGTIEGRATVPLKGSISPRVKRAGDDGPVSSNLKLEGLTLAFSPSAAQQADLKQLLLDQQTPGSSSFHKWLTPAQYAARFGVSDADMAKVDAWLSAEGFSVSGTDNSHTRVRFSGTAAQVEAAFSTELHRYALNGETHVANASQIKVPSALAGIVANVGNIADFRPRPHLRRIAGAGMKPKYTSSQSGDHYVMPGDLTTIYDLQPLYTAGYDGTGQRIAIAGQSEVLLSDIANFRSAAGLTAKAPVPVLMPGTGTATVSSGDEEESDLDLEYSGAVAKNADLYFVYTGSDQNYGAFDALQYAVDTDLAPVISISYGSCEADLGTSEFTALEAVFQQANSQGQTIFAASGDSGATDCDDSSTETITSATQGLAVDYPSASQYVTGVGGTMFDEGSGSYWSSTNSTSGGSALSYIPEEAWNETTVSIAAQGGLSASGGGASALTTKPSWQTGVGVPADGHRDVPDIALDSAVYHDPYLLCSSDSQTDVTGSCTNGFRDATDTYLTAAGGTSFAAPISAGIFTLINEKTGSTGQGNLNPMLYALAASLPSAFHDITVGDNKQPCTTGSTDCADGGTIGYSAGTGYDQVTGLGSLDAAVLAGGFSVTTSALLATTVTLTPADTSVTSGTSVTLTATVASADGTPTGSVQFAVDGTAAGDAVAVSGSTATYSFSSTQTGSHIISATYAGNSTYATSYAVGTVTVTAAAATGTGTFALAGTSVTAMVGGSATSTITVTPANGYAGTVAFTVAATDTALNTYGCYDISNATVTAGAAATTTLTLYTSEAACSTTTSAQGRKLHRFGGSVAEAGSKGMPASAPALPLSLAAMGGALFLIAARRRSPIWMAVLLIVIGSGISMTSIGCGSSSSTVSADVPAGSYTLTVTGTDTTSAAITASTTVELTVN